MKLAIWIVVRWFLIFSSKISYIVAELVVELVTCFCYISRCLYFMKFKNNYFSSQKLHIKFNMENHCAERFH